MSDDVLITRNQTISMNGTKKTAATLAGATMAAAAGVYYLYGSEKASTHRRKVGAWMRRAEREIVYEAKRLKDTAFTDANAKRIINVVASRYQLAKALDPKDVKQFVAAVRKSWKDAGKVVKSRGSVLRTTMMKTAKRTKTSARKVVAKTTKTAKKAKKTRAKA